MSTEDNKATVDRFFEEVYNQGKVAVIDELCVPNLLYHEPGLPDVHGSEDLKRYVTAARSAFPDLRVTIEDMFAEGEQVAIRYMFRGTNTGVFALPTMRFPATGKQVSLMGIAIIRFAGGKAVEVWDLSDNLSMVRQLGLMPAS